MDKTPDVAAATTGDSRFQVICTSPFSLLARRPVANESVGTAVGSTGVSRLGRDHHVWSAPRLIEIPQPALRNPTRIRPAVINLRPPDRRRAGAASSGADNSG